MKIKVINLVIILAIIGILVLGMDLVFPKYTWRLFFPAAMASITAAIIYDIAIKDFIISTEKDQSSLY